MSDNQATRRVRVWDLPLRLFHWLLLVAVCTAFYAVWTDNLELHAKAGYSVLALLVFRLIWGFVGGTHARFFNFIKGPSTIRAYFGKAHDASETGHNPLGAFSVIAMLAALLVQAITGLFNHNDDFFFDGPLYKFVSSDVYGKLAEVHEITQYIILALIGLHIAAILFYFFVKRDNLVTAMITGRKKVPANATTQDAQGGNLLIGAVALCIGLGVIWYISTR